LTEFSNKTKKIQGTEKGLYMRLFRQIFAGAGLGFLIGLIVGLTAEGLAATLCTTIVAMLAGFFGLQKQDKDQADATPREYLVGAFGLFCGLSLLLGIYFRANNVLSPTSTIKDRVAEYTDAGFSLEEAKQVLLVGKYLDDKVVDSSDDHSNTLLFSLSEDQCNTILTTEYANFDALIDTYQALGNEVISAIGSRVKKMDIDAAQKISTMQAVAKALCEVDHE
jgi:hypothetical protein